MIANDFVQSDICLDCHETLPFWNATREDFDDWGAGIRIHFTVKCPKCGRVYEYVEDYELTGWGVR